jgi:hypothetical protein
MVVFAGMTALGVGVWFFTSALESVAADQTRATRSFADVRARFDGREPIMRMTDRRPIFSNTLPPRRRGTWRRSG